MNAASGGGGEGVGEGVGGGNDLGGGLGEEPVQGLRPGYGVPVLTGGRGGNPRPRYAPPRGLPWSPGAAASASIAESFMRLRVALPL